MATEVIIRQKDPQGPPDEKGKQQTISSNTTSTEVISLRTAPGKRGRLTVLGVDDGGGALNITWHLLVNGNRLPPYDAFQFAPCPVFDAQSRLPTPVDLPQTAFISLQVDNADVTNSYTVAARIVVEYEDF